VKIASGILLSALVLAGSAARADQILINPGFETGSLSPWVNGRDFGGTVPWAITSTDCHSGSFCAEDTGNIELEQTFSAVSTSSITDVAFWAEHPDASVTALAVEFFYQGGGDDQFIVNTTGTGWNSFDVTADLRSGAQLVGFSIFGNSAGVTLADDFSITANTTATPEPSSALLLAAGLALAVGFRRKLGFKVS
jgi:PEP-CTERM motif